MERKGLPASTILILAVILISNLLAQSNTVKNSMVAGKILAEEAYIKYDKGLFEKSRKIFETIYAKNNSNMLALYYTTYIDFRFLEMSFQPGDEYLFDKYYEPALKNSQLVSEDKKLGVEGKIIQAGIYMMNIAKDMSRAPVIYPKILSLLEEVQKNKPNNPRVYMILGRLKLNTPEVMGGGPKEALTYFNKSIVLSEKQNKKDNINWGYLTALLWAGQTYDMLGDRAGVDRIYDKIMSVAPNFSQVKCLRPQ